MFVGHAFLAFGLVALLARREESADRPFVLPGGVTVGFAVAAGLAAALFSSLPDVDVAHAAFQVVTLPEGSTAFDHFWAATGERHRTTTHSLLIGLLASAGFALWTVSRWAGAIVLAGIVVITTLTGGVIGGGVMLLFVIAGIAVAMLATRTGLSGRAIFGASAFGLAVHPFTDLLTGDPPAFFAPVEATLIGGRIEPFADPTLNLLAAFGTELAVIWFGLVVGLTFVGIDPRQHVHWAAAIGVVYAPMALVLEQPSVDSATPFVATILATGVVGVIGWRRPWTSGRAVTILLTALATVTVAWFAFGVSYVALVV